MGTVYIKDEDEEYLNSLAVQRTKFTGVSHKLKDILHELIQNG